MRKRPKIEPRALNLRQAAAYWGVSANTYKKLEHLGLAPGPIKLPGVLRRLYDKAELDEAMDARRAGKRDLYDREQQDRAIEALRRRVA
jgi:hypothetical protein